MHASFCGEERHATPSSGGSALGWQLVQTACAFSSSIKVLFGQQAAHDAFRRMPR